MNKRTLILSALLPCLAYAAFAQTDPVPDKKNAITIGFLQGGGGLVGFDYERLIAGGVGLQLGVGITSVGAGLTFHLNEETTDSSAIWAGVWNQGVPGDTRSATYIGMSSILRGWGWLNGQIGLGYVVFVGDGMKAATGIGEKTKVLLLYSLGWYKGF